jgi:hypothetical protein
MPKRVLCYPERREVLDAIVTSTVMKSLLAKPIADVADVLKRPASLLILFQSPIEHLGLAPVFRGRCPRKKFGNGRLLQLVFFFEWGAELPV